MKKDREDAVEARRRFMARCGTYAAITPPTVGLLLSAANRNYAVASSGHGNTGAGNGIFGKNTGYDDHGSDDHGHDNGHDNGHGDDHGNDDHGHG